MKTCPGLLVREHPLQMAVGAGLPQRHLWLPPSQPPGGRATFLGDSFLSSPECSLAGLLSWESRRVATAQGDGGSRPGLPPWEPMDTLTHQPEMQKQAQCLQTRTGSHGVERAEQEVA